MVNVNQRRKRCRFSVFDDPTGNRTTDLPYLERTLCFKTCVVLKTMNIWKKVQCTLNELNHVKKDGLRYCMLLCQMTVIVLWISIHNQDKTK